MTAHSTTVTWKLEKTDLFEVGQFLGLTMPQSYNEGWPSVETTCFASHVTCPISYVFHCFCMFFQKFSLRYGILAIQLVFTTCVAYPVASMSKEAGFVVEVVSDSLKT